MPLMGSLYIGTSGLQTSQNALNTTGHNMTNTDTVGYVRQQTQLTDKDYNIISKNASSVSYGQTGLGVCYSQVRQVRDVFLDQTYREESGRLAFYETMYDAIGETETLLGELDGASFQNSINDLWVAVQELAKDPSSSVTQGLLVQRAYAFMTDAQAVYDGLSSYQNDLNYDVKETVNTINDYGKRIYELNEAIRKIETGGIEHANDLHDERNQLLDELSSLAKISYSDDSAGNVLVKIEGHAFVTPERVNEIGLQLEETTGLYDVFWLDDAPFHVNSEGITVYDVKEAPLYDFSVDISPVLDSDIGKLKSLIITRGDHRANYTDILPTYDADGNEVVSAKDNYSKISDSVLMTTQAEFDKLINAVVTAVNGVLEEAFQNGDGTYMSDGNGNAMQLFQRSVADPSDPVDVNLSESLFSTPNLIINQELMQTPAKLSFLKADGSVDYESAEKLKNAFETAEYTLNPTLVNKMNINSFYAALVAQVANTGSVSKSIRDSQQVTVDSTENARQQIIGVSSDEEMSNMIRFQNAYNASSRYINVVDQMLEHILNTLGS